MGILFVIYNDLVFFFWRLRYNRTTRFMAKTCEMLSINLETVHDSRKHVNFSNVCNGSQAVQMSPGKLCYCSGAPCLTRWFYSIYRLPEETLKANNPSIQ